MIEKYNMNNKQKEQLAEIRKEEYLSMWSNVLYGSSAGSNDIVQVAFSQIGNICIILECQAIVATVEYSVCRTIPGIFKISFCRISILCIRLV